MVVDFAKAFELETNLILRRGLRGVAESERRVNIDGRSVDLVRGDLWSLGELARTIGETQHINALLKKRLVHGERFTASLPPVLRKLGDLRNPAAHSGRIERQAATELRNSVPGVGNLQISGDGVSRITVRPLGYSREFPKPRIPCPPRRSPSMPTRST